MAENGFQMESAGGGLNDLRYNRKTETGAFFAGSGGEIWLENFADDRTGNAASLVLHRDAEEWRFVGEGFFVEEDSAGSGAQGTDVDGGAMHFRGDADGLVIAGALESVYHEVQQNLCEFGAAQRDIDIDIERFDPDVAGADDWVDFDEFAQIPENEIERGDGGACGTAQVVEMATGDLGADFNLAGDGG